MILNKKISKLLILKGFALIIPLAVNSVTYPTSAQINPNPPPQNSPSRTMTVRSDIQEADSRTGVVTARGNVQINYPARKIQATAAQAQYFSRERRIVLSGDVFILQEGNTIRGETVTYLIDEGRFIALPQSQGQVESVYLVPTEQDTGGGNDVTAPFNPKPAFKSPISP
ncbi:MAG: OstA family protein [Okeania sp. SIO3B5]|uniref:LptA/OstA family protein n=1 Tax=Okeania sp. SIO3B5 TaxID=2607811 RepID=UPI001400E517|nr:LptA/OstA family protein [Okeania sp. SIO3B5]NEO57831.1 OstA family protein [Okeania sp. SIO3B5]